MPFVSVYYYNSNQPSFSSTVAPANWIYNHAFGLWQGTYAGRRIDGIVIWIHSGGSCNEAQLSAVYQGMKGLTYNASFPRP